MKAWIFQRPSDEGTGVHRVGWYDPEGKRREKMLKTKKAADSFLRKVEGEIAAGSYKTESLKKWPEFRKQFEDQAMGNMAPGTRDRTLEAMDAFERIVKPSKVSKIKTVHIDEFIAKRSKGRGRRKGDTISPATINRDLRHLRSVLRKAVKWGYLPSMPDIEMRKEYNKLPSYVTPEDFAAMYQHCDAAKFPAGQPFTAEEFWKGLITFLYMTGWRIGETIALRRHDLDLELGQAITRAETNKGKRDEITPLHPVVVDHLRPLANFSDYVFPWPLPRRRLYKVFHQIQKAAGIELECHADHTHTDSCYRYGFHDLRRGFATMNVGQLSGDALQALMRHKNYETTKRYINMANEINRSAEKIHVPEFLRISEVG
jgi:integrase